MIKTTRHKRKPDIIMLLTIFVCLGVVLTTTVNAAEPADKGWGIQLSAETGCMQAETEWLTCNHWQQGVQEAAHVDALSPQRAALRLSSGRLPDTGLVAYYTLSDSRQFDDNGDQRFHRGSGYFSSYDTHQFGMALKQNYGRFGISLGFEADRVNNLADDPLIYFGVSNRW